MHLLHTRVPLPAGLFVFLLGLVIGRILAHLNLDMKHGLAAFRTDKTERHSMEIHRGQLDKTTSELLLGSHWHGSVLGLHGHIGCSYSDMLSFSLSYPKTAHESGEQLLPSLVRTSVSAAGHAKG